MRAHIILQIFINNLSNVIDYIFILVSINIWIDYYFKKKSKNWLELT
jgi:hypothetical protein